MIVIVIDRHHHIDVIVLRHRTAADRALKIRLEFLSTEIKYQILIICFYYRYI